MTTFWIPQRNIGELADRIAKLNKRADRLGIESIRFERTGGEACRWTASERLGGGILRYEVVEVEVEGAFLGLNGWTFLGTVEHLDGTNVLRSVPGQTIPEDFRAAVRQCDHCGLDRQRVDTFVVQHEDGTTKQLGRSCLQDYIGSVDGGKLASWLESFWALVSDRSESDEERGPRWRPTERPTDVVAVAIGAVRHGGYVKADGSTGVPTKTIVRLWLGGGSEQEKLEAKGMTVEADDFTAADEMIEWARQQIGQNDYIANLHAYAMQERVEDRAIGLLASLPTAYGRAMGQLAERKARDEQRAAEREVAEDAPSGRIAVEGIVVGLKTQESQYGAVEKMTVLVQAGWRFYCTVPSSIAGDVHLGDTVRMTATFEPTQDDAKFAWATRPSKASIIERAATEAAAPDGGPVDQSSPCPERDGRGHMWIEIVEGEPVQCATCGAFPHHLSENAWILARDNGAMARAAGWVPPALQAATEAACA